MEASEFYQKIRTQLKEFKPLVAYRKPGDKLNIIKGLFQEDSQAHSLKELSESGFIFSPFNPEQKGWIIPAEASEIISFEDKGEEGIDSELFEHLSQTTDFEFLEEDQKAHEKLVQSGIDRIKAGDFQKVVLARSEKVQLYDPDPVRIFKKLLNKYSQAFVYLWYHPETGIWLGATPESLIKTERTRFKTMALAGTQIFKGEEDVAWGQKEVEEQQFVTDYILDSLKKVSGIEIFDTSEPHSVRAGNLLHIRTEITGSFQEPEQLEKIIGELHPTPAVCGLPKEKALSFILENEKLSREYYSGYLGELNMKTETRRNSNRRNQENQQFKAISKKTDLYVNLRCMKLREGHARIFIGGGITKDSNAADEWMETVNKSQTMKAVLVK